jgi:hypothetical protein
MVQGQGQLDYTQAGRKMTSCLGDRFYYLCANVGSKLFKIGY